MQAFSVSNDYQNSTLPEGKQKLNAPGKQNPLTTQGTFQKPSSQMPTQDQSLLKIWTTKLALFCIVLLKAQRKWTMPVISDSFTGEKNVQGFAVRQIWV